MTPRKKILIQMVSFVATCVIIFSVLPIVTTITKGASDSYSSMVLLPNQQQLEGIDPSVDNTVDPSLFQGAQLFFASLFGPNGFKEIEDLAYEAIGVVQILEPGTNIRTEADPTNSSNIAWVANQWEKYVVVDMTSYGDTRWYEILKPGTVNETYYVSSLVSSVVAGNGESVSDTVQTDVEEMVDAYFKARKAAFKDADFSHIEPYILPNSALYYAEINSIQAPPLKMSDYEIVNIYTSQEGNLHVRVFEENLSRNSSSDIQHTFYLHDFLVMSNENGDYQFTEKVNSAYLVK